VASYTIGQLAEAAGVGVETVRFYERRGLLDPPPRTPSGYRRYGDDDRWRLEFVARAKALGFTLAEIRDLLAGDERRPDAVLVAARAKLTDVAAQLDELRAVQARLTRLVRVCADEGRSGDCTALAGVTTPQVPAGDTTSASTSSR
jgi:MerR family transcriptional regulator, copper efflux regulator